MHRLIDDAGRTWDPQSLELRRSLNAVGLGPFFPEYTIKNIGFVELSRSAHGVSVRLRPAVVSPLAYAQLMFELADVNAERVLLSYFDTGAWRHEIIPTRERAFERITQLAAPHLAAHDDNVRCRDLDPSLLSLPDMFRRAISYWRWTGGSWRTVKDIGTVCDVVLQRFVLFECSGEKGFVFRDFGRQLPPCATAWLARGIGMQVEEQPDAAYGRSCARSYAEAMRSFEPKVDEVDAWVSWPGYGRTRRRYRRLMLPFQQSDDRFGLLSATLEDSSIDLRPLVA
jgi:hypothetical protein